MIIDRWSKIINILIENNEISVKALAEKVDVSIATIRRDIKQLGDRNILTCKNGTVKIGDVDNSVTPDFGTSDIIFFRQGKSPTVKNTLARYAAELIHNNDIIYIDAGSTTSNIIPFIKAKNILVITNSPTALPDLISAGIKTYVCGGFISSGSGAIYGGEDFFLEGMNIITAFLGTTAINASGFYSSFRDSQMKRQIIAKSKKVYVLADSSKYGKNALLRFALPEEVTLISDKTPPFDTHFRCIVLPIDGQDVRTPE